jgi:hypothetical protein
MSIDGLYVGKKFVFMASEYQAGTFFTILAIEKSTVTVTDEDGGQNSYSVDACMYKNIILIPVLWKEHVKGRRQLHNFISELISKRSKHLVKRFLIVIMSPGNYQDPYNLRFYLCR